MLRAGGAGDLGGDERDGEADGPPTLNGANIGDSDLDHPTRGRFSTIISPLRLSDSPVEARRAPLYGEHTADVLQNLAGYTPEEIAALRDKGVIPQA